MGTFLAGCLILNLFFFDFQDRTALRAKRCSGGQQVAKGFSYPEARETIKADAPHAVKSLTGKVVDSSNMGMEKVLVERLSNNWGKRLDATFTNSNGRFFLPSSSPSIQYLKLSKPGFDTLLIRVRIRKRSKATLGLALNPST
jgi:hypothetical protein